MKAMKETAALSLLLVLTAFLIMLHQYLLWGDWWTMNQFLHHETFAAIALASAIGVLTGSIITKLKR